MVVVFASMIKYSSMIGNEMVGSRLEIMRRLNREIL
jgi:hypothetical protein